MTKSITKRITKRITKSNTKKSATSKPTSTKSPLDLTPVRAELLKHARALGIPEGAAESFVDHALIKVQKSLKSKSTITNRDLTRLIAKEIKNYNADLAYVYQNYDTII